MPTDRARADRPRAFLLDFDGVIALAGRAIPGSPEAIRRLDEAGMPYRIITNSSMTSRATLAGAVAARGLEVPVERWITALSVSAAWTARTLRGKPLFVIASDDAKAEFAGQHLLTDAEAQAPDATAAAVVIGDSPEALSWANVNAAFGLVRRGARLIAMHRNKWWLTPGGPTIDAGAFVVAIEFAADARATVIGKPSRTAFAEAVRSLRHDEPWLRREDVVMVGDDLASDVGGARRAGLRTAFVLSGKQGEADLAAARRRGNGPDYVAADLGELVATLT